jgi:hypothetical protein
MEGVHRMICSSSQAAPTCSPNAYVLSSLPEMSSYDSDKGSIGPPEESVEGRRHADGGTGEFLEGLRDGGGNVHSCRKRRRYVCSTRRPTKPSRPLWPSIPLFQLTWVVIRCATSAGNSSGGNVLRRWYIASELSRAVGLDGRDLCRSFGDCSAGECEEVPSFSERRETRNEGCQYATS